MQQDGVESLQSDRVVGRETVPAYHPYHIIIIFFAHQHKAADVKTKQNVKQRCNDFCIISYYNTNFRRAITHRLLPLPVAIASKSA